MGFSSEAIFMKPRISEDEEILLLEFLGFEHYQFNQKVPFEQADSKDKQGVYVGHCNNSSFIIYDGIVSSDSRAGSFTILEELLSSKYPNKVFLSVMNFEVINGYVYHYFRDGETIRLKEGLDPHVYHNVGAELDIEKEYYVKKKVDGEKELYFTRHWDESNSELLEWEHHQVGGEIAFRLVEKLAGVDYRDFAISESTINQYLPRNGSPEIGLETLQRYQRKIHQEQGLSGQNLKPNKINSINPLFLEEVDIPSAQLVEYGLEDSRSIMLTRHEINIDALPVVVWQVLTQLNNWPDWYPEITEPQISFTVDKKKTSLWKLTHFHFYFSRVKLEGHVSEFYLNQKIAWVVAGNGTMAYYHWQIIPTEKGCKVILKTAQRGWKVWLSKWISKNRLSRKLQNWLNCLRVKSLNLENSNLSDFGIEE